MQDFRAELAQSLDEAELDWLKPHIQRDVVLVVTKELDLLDVGVAIAQDDIVSVQHWISEALIAKPSTQQLSNWNSDRARQFNTLIVQPYVLVQELSAA